MSFDSHRVGSHVVVTAVWLGRPRPIGRSMDRIRRAFRFHVVSSGDLFDGVVGPHGHRVPVAIPAPDQATLRRAGHREALWAGLAGGDIDTLCSDHAAWTLEDKLDPAMTAVTSRQGVADLETMLPMLYSGGVGAGRLSLDRFVELASTNAARIFGLCPRKGAIAVGSDADIAEPRACTTS
jgi:hypothetical protein